MDNLLFYTLLALLAYYFLVYLPAQKSNHPVPTLKHSFTQTDPLPETEPTPNPETIKNLQSQITALTQNQSQKDAEISAKQRTIQNLESKKASEISALQSQLNQLTSTQKEKETSTKQEQKELDQALDQLIKGINDLSKDLDKY